ncbi:hypothetical protein EPA93_12970 [Ktedonosporobacter rubrisoli]|uniref:Uncharacterized protein n=1 Tax=Ktedonosporobacter rubrisoli TaxID=2509675 RepID=A0A4P6JQ22_KTERU|nr:hypothetical protein [Ktedonosporobacter rubrisoli]QBD76866.1 hypothetical protein EPA93_12970 [Ktedonosporobacter rubrisoli]
MESYSLRSLKEVQQLTQEYASYSQSKGGLGHVLGGVVGLAIYLLNGLVGPGLLTAILTIALTLSWLFGKEILRRLLYRKFGQAQEIWTAEARKWHRGTIIFIILIFAIVGIVYIWLSRMSKPSDWLYMLFVVAMPLIAWRYLRTWEEFSVGIFLLCACAVTGGGGAYGLLDGPWVAGIALIMIFKGFREHSKFRALAARLQAQLMVKE